MKLNDLLLVLGVVMLFGSPLFAKPPVDLSETRDEVKALKNVVSSFSSYGCFEVAAKKAIETAHTSAAAKELEIAEGWLQFSVHQFGISASDRILVSIALQQRWKGDEKGEGGLGQVLDYEVTVSQNPSPSLKNRQKTVCSVTKIKPLNEN